MRHPPAGPALSGAPSGTRPFPSPRGGNSRAPLCRRSPRFVMKTSSPEARPENIKKPRCAGLFQCAREDSNLHGPYSPQGPQPCTGRVDASTGVQIVQIGRFAGRIRRIGRNGCCHGCCHGQVPRRDGSSAATAPRELEARFSLAASQDAAARGPAHGLLARFRCSEVRAALGHRVREPCCVRGRRSSDMEWHRCWVSPCQKHDLDRGAPVLGAPVADVGPECGQSGCGCWSAWW